MLSQNQVVSIRKTIERFYTDKLIVYGFDIVNDNGIDREIEREILNVPCFMTFIFGERETYAREHAPVLNQRVKIFTAPEYNIPPGSNIKILKQGKEWNYKMSGMPALYPTHQEIVVTIEEDYAGDKQISN